MTIRVGINGFGRIGRLVLRAGLGKDGIEFVGINDLSDAGTLAHLLKYDSVHGRLADNVSSRDNAIEVGDTTIAVSSERDPARLPWRELEVDVVVESTGIFTSREDAAKHLSAGASKVIISAPAKDPDVTLALGVNEEKYDRDRHDVISNASCTTNCLAPVSKVIHENFTLEKGFMTTIHAYTSDQRILDFQHSDLRRARAAAVSMIPTSTGAAKAIGLVLPELNGKLDGISIRVPTADVSLVDLICNVSTDTTIEEVNRVLKEAAEGKLKGIMDYNELPLVSADYIGNPHSSIVDGLSTNVIENDLVKVLSWYDNEWGYSSRVIDLISLVI